MKHIFNYISTFETFLIIRIIEQDIVKMYIGFQFEVPVIVTF